MTDNPEFDQFNAAMDKILKADPKQVREQMEAEKTAREQYRARRQKHHDPEQ